jgi:hypothetical protein
MREVHRQITDLQEFRNRSVGEHYEIIANSLEVSGDVNISFPQSVSPTPKA